MQKCKCKATTKSWHVHLKSCSLHLSVLCFSQVVCGQNCTFLVLANGTVLAVGEGSYGRLGQGNSDDLYTPTIISALQGNANHSKLIFRPVPVICVVHRCHLHIEYGGKKAENRCRIFFFMWINSYWELYNFYLMNTWKFHLILELFKEKHITIVLFYFILFILLIK